LRKSEIQRGEAGGITQHLGAYRVTHGEHSVVILDTPGHAAFTAMRARGANLTDVVVLVVAADDGVMPQTEEALDHAKAAEVPVVVAINKCDKPDANPMRARQQLSALGLQPEEWGGNTQFVDVSALSGEGLDELIEKIGLEALVLELKANPDGHASGTVIEAKQTPAQGNVVSLLVMDGTLNRGDLVLCGHGTGRIRVLLDDHGRQLDQAPPGTPVEVLGLPELPSPGDRFHALEDMKMAKEVAQARAQKIRSMDIAEKSKARMMDLQSQLAAKKVAEIRLILKADVMGSLEPIRESLEKLSTDEVRLRILHAGIGGITETDVSLADASDALIVGFNSTLDEKARAKADQDGVQVRFYNVIYELIDDARNVLEGLLSPELKEEIRGHAEVRRVFKSSKFGNIAGCFVLDGIINRNHKCRVKRGGSLIHTSRISSLRREKDDVRDVRENFECGIRVEGFNDYQADDILEAFEVVEIKRTLGDPV
ncbi:MAG: translation initiation factor IF-2, partial [Planctomycetota bacterium]